MEEKVKEYTADIVKYTAKPDKKLVAALARRMAGVMARPDARYVATTDPEELKRVRVSFISAKLGIKDAKKADAALAKVAEMMKSDKTKSRVTFYYLLTVELKAKAAYLN